MDSLSAWNCGPVCEVVVGVGEELLCVISKQRRRTNANEHSKERRARMRTHTHAQAAASRGGIRDNIPVWHMSAPKRFMKKGTDGCESNEWYLSESDCCCGVGMRLACAAPSAEE
jgi:hypothetical protein